MAGSTGGSEQWTWDQARISPGGVEERRARQRKPSERGAWMVLAILLTSLGLEMATIAIGMGTFRSDRVPGQILTLGLTVGLSMAVWWGQVWAQLVYSVLCIVAGALGIAMWSWTNSWVMLGLGGIYLLMGSCLLFHPAVRRFMASQRADHRRRR